jgi:septum formation protein
MRAAGTPKLVLASGSPRRLGLLEQAGITPDALQPADIDETPKRRELPRVLARRLAREKAEAALEIIQRDKGLKGALVLAADTVVAQGRRILPKPEVLEEATDTLRLLSGRAHRVYTGVALVGGGGKARERVVEARVRFKKLSREEMESYLASGEWRDKAGGYAIQGLAGVFVVRLIGSYTGVVGLPLYETVNMLVGAGYPVHLGWLGTTVED